MGLFDWLSKEDQQDEADAREMEEALMPKKEKRTVQTFEYEEVNVLGSFEVQEYIPLRVTTTEEEVDVPEL